MDGPEQTQQTDDRQVDIDQFLNPPVPDNVPELVGGQPQAPVPEPRRAEPASDDRLTKALQTIEGLTQEVNRLKTREPQIVYQDRPREVAPEMMEVLPGRMIPKDPSQRPIKLRGEDLVRMGWNEDPAQALNALANAFFAHIAEVVPAITLQHLGQQGQVYSAGERRQSAFYTDYPDLKDFQDLAQIVENQTMQELPIQSYNQSDWNREVGQRVRQRIAAMRGISLEQYTASLASRPSGAPRARAVTAPPGRGARAPQRDTQQAEMDDLLEGRL